MAPPTPGVTKRRSRVFVRTCPSITHATAAIAAMMPTTTPPFSGATHRPPAFPLPLPQLPGTEAAAKRTATPPERPPPQLRTRISPPVALSMPSLDMETTPPRTFTFAPTNPFSPPSMSRPDTEKTPPRSYAAKTAQQPPLAPASRKVPPIVVDQLPNWPHHFRQLREMLGHAPNARPYGKGVRFMARTEGEFRLYQSYLTNLERASGLSWFAYAPPAERSLKLAILGLPANTNPTDLEEELRNLDPTSEPTARSSLMAAANGPDGPKPRRPKRIRARAKPAPATTMTVEPQPTPTPNQAVAAPPRRGEEGEAPSGITIGSIQRKTGSVGADDPAAPQHPRCHPLTD
ncbi:proline-rich protein 36-like [Pectinophora gossypiella]|uniref:proline-rich protein 36-like n=1 Tax=Pectinophora gossypiella TaxID=13191 RepID=UPI00214E7466|nr:proline-rich protein 36-like [Pectinophora gossypiella]